MSAATHPPPSPTACTAHTSPASAPFPLTASQRFDEIYRKGEWGQPLSSGGGSSDTEAEPYLNLASAFIFCTRAKRVSDLGSGDGRVLKALANRHKGVSFRGYEFSEAIHETLWTNTKHCRNVVVFKTDLRDKITRQECDLILCKDVLHHWPNEMVRKFLASERPADLIFVADSDKASEFTDCEIGGYRPLNFLEDRWGEFSDRHGIRLVCRYLHKSVWFVPKNA